jgi:hypothetical protein
MASDRLGSGMVSASDPDDVHPARRSVTRWHRHLGTAQGHSLDWTRDE